MAAAKKSRARKVSTVPTRIWSYGALPPIEGGDLVRQQLKLGFEYYNKLVGIENEGRAEYREARRKFAPKIALIEQRETELSDKVKNAEGAVKECRRKAAAAKPDHNIRVNPKGLQARVKALKEERKTVREQLRVERLEIKSNPEFNDIVETLNKARSARTRAVRAETDLYWGSYLLAEKAVEAAKDSDTDPEPKRGTGIEGRVGIQIQPGVKLTTDRFLSGANHTMLRLEPAEGHTKLFEPDQWDTRSGRRSARAIVCIRVGSDEKRKPVWAKFPVLIHRKLPEGEIKWAWINIWKVGTRVKYELQLSVESRDFANISTGKGTVAVSLGWSQQPGDGALLIGDSLDDQGNTLTCMLPRDAVEKIRTSDRLQKHADMHFNAVRDVLARELKAGTKVPAWLREEAKTLPHWRSASRLARIAGRWTAEMFPDRAVVESTWKGWKQVSFDEGVDLFGTLRALKPDEKHTAEDYSKLESEIRQWLTGEGYNPTETLCLYLEWWRRKNRHLYQWKCDQQVKARGHRDEIFKIFASKLAKTYETVVLRDINWEALSRRAKPEADKEMGRGIRSNRQVAAPGKLEACIVSALGKSRVKFVSYTSGSVPDEDKFSTEKRGTIARALLETYFGNDKIEAAE